jgi:hypothetical protein
MIEHGDALRPLLEAEIGPITPDSVTFGWRDGGQLVCLVAFAHWSRGDIEIMGAARPGGIHRKMIRELARYAFSDCACNHISARVLIDNLPSIRLLERLGFVREGLQRKARDGQDLILFGLIPEDLRHGKQPKAAQAG